MEIELRCFTCSENKPTRSVLKKHEINNFTRLKNSDSAHLYTIEVNTFWELRIRGLNNNVKRIFALCFWIDSFFFEIHIMGTVSIHSYRYLPISAIFLLLDIGPTSVIQIKQVWVSQYRQPVWFSNTFVTWRCLTYYRIKKYDIQISVW